MRTAILMKKYCNFPFSLLNQTRFFILLKKKTEKNVPINKKNLSSEANIFPNIYMFNFQLDI